MTDPDIFKNSAFQIILFRDGVGDGQLDVVALFEAAQIEVGL